MRVFNSVNDTEVVNLIKGGAVGFMQTDTVYGLVCSAKDPQAVKRLYILKDRVHKPGTIIAANIDQLISLGIKRRYLSAVQQFWPNPISIEIPHAIAYLNQDTGRQALRVIKGNRDLLKLLDKVGPLLTSSANQPGEPPANNLYEGQEYFNESIDFYVDSGDLSNQKPSTLIRIIDDSVEILREGAIKVTESGEVVNSESK